MVCPFPEHHLHGWVSILFRQPSRDATYLDLKVQHILRRLGLKLPALWFTEHIRSFYNRPQYEKTW